MKAVICIVIGGFLGMLLGQIAAGAAIGFAVGIYLMAVAPQNSNSKAAGKSAEERFRKDGMEESASDAPETMELEEGDHL